MFKKSCPKNKDLTCGIIGHGAQLVFCTLRFQDGGFKVDKLSILGQGVFIAITGISVVFLSLVLLFFCMKLFVRLLQMSKSKSKETQKGGVISEWTGKEQITGEIAAAIAMAIHNSREEFHDLEQTIITLNRITRPYSPWSSKIHGIRRFVRN